jgi:hypothetical protein
MIETLTPYLQFIFIMSMIFFCAVISNEPNRTGPELEPLNPLRNEPEPFQSEANHQSEQSNTESNSKPSEEENNWSENFIFNPETGRTNTVEVKYNK